MAESTAVQPAKQPGPQIVQFRSIEDQVNAMFNEIARRAYQIFEAGGRQGGHADEDWLQAEREFLRPVAVQMNETNDALEVKAEVPGFTEKELEVSVDADRLTVCGRHEATKEETKGKTIYSETSSADVMRAITLPVQVDPSKATASLNNGVLTVTIPKAAQPKKIAVQSGAGD